MENSCLKKYKPSSKKWILASSYPEFRRNSALIPANAGLFHYAGNNPIRYIDPDGRFEFDSHNPMRIFANLDDANDLLNASAYLQTPNSGYTITGYGEKSGITKNFTSYRELLIYANSISKSTNIDFDISLFPEQNIKEHKRHEYKEVNFMRVTLKENGYGGSCSATFFSASGDFDTPIFAGAYAAILDGAIENGDGRIKLQGTLCQAGVRAGFRLKGYRYMISLGGDIGAGFDFSFSRDSFIIDAAFLGKVRIERTKENYDDYKEK